MKSYNTQREIRALLFDIDNTLYRNDTYCEMQIELLLKRFAYQKGMPLAIAKELIERERGLYHEESKGGKTSTGNLMERLGVSIEENAHWRNELFRPEDYLTYDNRLVNTIHALSETYRLAVVTNNTISIGRRTLQILGVGALITAIVGLDTCYISKPAFEPYQKALELLSAKPEWTVSVGDRYEVDIAMPIEMGMAGILIETMEDLYSLPEFLSTIEPKS